MSKSSASDPVARISVWEKLHDIREKVGQVGVVIGNLLPGGMLQLASANVRGHDMKVLKNLPAALGDVYRQFFIVTPKKVWLRYERETYTFEEAEKLMNAVAADLQNTFGVRPGDTVAIGMRNLPEFMIAFLAITCMGAVAVPLNALWKSEELEYAMKDSGAKVLFADAQRLTLCKSFLVGLGIRPILCRGDAAAAPGVESWQTVVARGAGKPIPSTKTIRPDDTSMIMYTSGSTGYPKGVVHTQRSVGHSMLIGHLVAKLTPMQDPKTILAVPLFHITALANVFLWSIPAGEELIIMHKWDAGVALKTIESMKVTKFTGVPTMVRDMLEHPSYTPKAMASMKNMTAGGAPVPPSQVASMRSKAKGTTPSQGYGLTETMGGVVVNKGIDYMKRPTSCGRPIPFLVQVVIKDPGTSKEVADGQRGEICIGGPLLMKGYHNRPEDTKKAFDPQGYFRTGDVGKKEGGFIYILDRLKDIIIRGGENIDCSEVEAALYTHSSVRECSVFGLPDERLGEVVGAAVWVQGGVLGAPELSAHAAKSLAKFKVPEAHNIFFHSEELPKGPTGKIAKKDLRAHYAEIMKSQAPRSKL